MDNQRNQPALSIRTTTHYDPTTRTDHFHCTLYDTHTRPVYDRSYIVPAGTRDVADIEIQFMLWVASQATPDTTD